MKTIYVNILGTWTKLDKNALIQNTNAYVWIQENNLHEYEFITISFPIAKKGYKIHTSNVIIETIAFN